jgi:iron complex transport system substrate-binding protein
MLEMGKKIKIFAILAGLLSFVLLNSACSNNGANSESSASNASNTEQASPSQETESQAASPFPRTIKDANGEVTIETQPKKVAVVHWGYGDSLLLFDVKSVGLALPFTEKQSAIHSDFYKPYVDKLDELKVVGENTTVNMEALLAYDPDLIIAGNAINKDIGESLSKIATTVVIDEAATDVWSDWPALVAKFGEILGQEDVAERYIAEFQSKLQDAKEKLANVEGTVAFVQVRDKAVWLQGTNYLKQYYDGMGLTPPDTKDIAEGAQLSLEGLIELDPDHLFLGYFNYGDKSIPALTDEWDDNEIWSKLKSVQNEQTYAINGELALGYGPISHSYGVEAVLEALEK